MISLLLLVVFLALIALRMPVSFSMGISTLAALLVSGYDLRVLPQYIANGVQSYPLMAVPFFILAGTLMNGMGITRRIFGFAQLLVGHIQGGLAQVNIVASMVFAGISGAAVADAAGLGTIEMEAMNEAGYRPPFSAAVTVASSTVGPIIPPSIVMVIYAVTARVSIARLFLAGVVPGILIGLVLMGLVYWLARSGREHCPITPRAGLREILAGFGRSFFALLSPVIILWGMVGGVVTPTEAGVLAILYALLTGFAYGELSPRRLPAIFGEAVRSTSLIMFLIAMATPMGWLFTIERTPQVIAEFLISFAPNKYAVLFIINVFLLFMGTILEGIPLLIITIPIFLPVLSQFQIDPVHFGVVMCFNILIGIVTPPVGIGLFIMTSIAEVTFEEVARAVLPFLAALLVSLLLITYLPDLSLWLPRLLMGPSS